MWYWFDLGSRKQIHEEWNDTLEENGLNKKKRAEECNRNYDAIDSEEHEKAKKLTEGKPDSSKIQYMSEKTQQQNTKLQQEQIEELESGNPAFPTQLKLEIVRRDESRWRLK